MIYLSWGKSDLRSPSLTLKKKKMQFDVTFTWGGFLDWFCIRGL